MREIAVNSDAAVAAQTYKQSASGIYLPRRIARKSSYPTVFSLFAGVGGFDLGFMQAGFEVVGGNEYDGSAALTYMVNLCSYPVQIHYIEGKKDKERLNKACERYIFGRGKVHKDEIHMGHYPEHGTPSGVYNRAAGSGFSGSGWIRSQPDIPPVRNFWFGDVRKLGGKDILDTLGMKEGELDCVCGGPPCQGFSISGKRDIADPRNNLVYEFARLIVELQPKAFVMENVQGILSMFDPDGVLVIDKFAMMVSGGGYGKWKKIKEGMMMQAGCAAGIKSAPKAKDTDDKDTDPEPEQLSFI